MIYQISLSRSSSLLTKGQPQSLGSYCRIPSDPTARIRYHLYSIWLFTFSDLKTIIVPSFLFGVATVTSSEAFGIPCGSSWSTICTRMPLALLWLWINLLPFEIDNQRRPGSIDEDGLNKPWRTMPSKRMTPQQATRLMFVLYAIAFMVSLRLGPVLQCVSLMVLGSWYNDRGGSETCVLRNFINGCGFVCFLSGALEVLLGFRCGPDSILGRWVLLISIIVFTTVQTQDMYDQAGDKLRDRQTIPVAYGDTFGRWSIAIPMTFWSVFVPWYWSLTMPASLIPSSVALLIAYRTLSKRTVQEDKVTFRIWNFWMVLNYTLPIMHLATGS